MHAPLNRQSVVPAAIPIRLSQLHLKSQGSLTRSRHKLCSAPGGVPIAEPLMQLKRALKRALCVNRIEELGTVLVDISGPVSTEQIVAAEQELGVDFPESYRAFLRLYGAGRLEWLDIFGLPQDRLWGDVVAMNQ